MFGAVMNDRAKVAPPLAAIMALTELIEKSLVRCFQRTYGI